MTDKQTKDCEYLLKVGEMRTCKALNVSFYSDMICDEGHCIILKLKQQLKAKEQAEEKLVKQIQTICDFINNRPETFKGINGSVDKIITDYAEAKEQECERLRFPMPDTNYAILTKEEFEQLDQLKAENEKLKKLLKVRIEDLCDSCGAGSMMPMPCKVYEKTLTDIKQIMKKHCRKCQKDKFYHFKLCCTCKYTDIIQKISEVENDT